jgi:predicted transcriptional regulator
MGDVDMSNVSQYQTASVAFDVEALSVTEQFHQVNNLIPDDQELLTILPDTSVLKAIDLMREHRFSQLLVKQGDEVLGIFSYRSFSTLVASNGQANLDYGKLPVDEFIEPLRYVSVRDDLESTFEYLDRDDAILVGQADNAQGIVTAMDVLRYLYEITSLFVMLGEIELTLRRIISACVDDEQLQNCIENCNEKLRKNKKNSQHLLPLSLDSMTFKHYELLISMNWGDFEKAFGVGEWQRKNTQAKLGQVGDLRNDVCHFRRETTSEDGVFLWNFRFWLQNKAKVYEAKRVTSNDPTN